MSKHSICAHAFFGLDESVVQKAHTLFTLNKKVSRHLVGLYYKGLISHIFNLRAEVLFY